MARAITTLPATRSTMPSGGLLMPSSGPLFTAPEPDGDEDGDSARGLRFGPSAVIQPGGAPGPIEQVLGEHPALAGYAQGFPTNITFSEAIGFLTRDEEDVADAPFLVTAHEAAHQWWGNILCPGRGPGGNLLSEGTAHFSTLLPLTPRIAKEAIGAVGVSGGDLNRLTPIGSTPMAQGLRDARDLLRPRAGLLQLRVRIFLQSAISMHAP